MLMVGLCILYPTLHIIHILAIFNLDKKSFYGLLQGLHPLIRVSDPSHRTPSCYTRHPSFKEFLRDVRRSGPLCLPDGRIHYSVASWALRVLSEAHMQGKRLPPHPLPIISQYSSGQVKSLGSNRRSTNPTAWPGQHASKLPKD
jgi:hypothetical protein